jgi:hypothetical protein
MTFRGFILRLVYVTLFTWVVGSIYESFGWALYFALMPIFFHEMVRPRWQRDDNESDYPQDE